MTKRIEDVLKKEIKANPAVLDLVEAFDDMDKKLTQMGLIFIRACDLWTALVEEDQKDLKRMDDTREHMKNIYVNLKAITELWEKNE